MPPETALPGLGYARHYNRHRPHQARGKLPPPRSGAPRAGHRPDHSPAPTNPSTWRRCQRVQIPSLTSCDEFPNGTGCWSNASADATATAGSVPLRTNRRTPADGNLGVLAPDLGVPPARTQDGCGWLSGDYGDGLSKRDRPFPTTRADDLRNASTTDRSRGDSPCPSSAPAPPRKQMFLVCVLAIQMFRL